MNKIEVQLIKKSNGEYCAVPIGELFENGWLNDPLVRCEGISKAPKLGWWIYESQSPAWNVVDTQVTVRDFTDNDYDEIMKNNGKLFVEVDSENRLSIVRNGLGHGKVVFHLAL